MLSPKAPEFSGAFFLSVHARHPCPAVKKPVGSLWTRRGKATMPGDNAAFSVEKSSTRSRVFPFNELLFKAIHLRDSGDKSARGNFPKRP